MGLFEAMEMYEAIAIIGVGMVLFSAAWQFFFEDSALKISQNGEFTRIDEKLNCIWGFVVTSAQTNDPKNIQSQYDRDRECYDKWRDLPDRPQKQLPVFKFLRASVFLVGSAFLLVAKYMQYIAC